MNEEDPEREEESVLLDRTPRGWREVCALLEGQESEHSPSTGAPRTNTRAASQHQMLASHVQESAPSSASTERLQVGGPVRFRRGEVVEAWHRTGGWHKATIHELLGDGSVKVAWADHDPTDRIKKRNKIRPVLVVP